MNLLMLSLFLAGIAAVSPKGESTSRRDFLIQGNSDSVRISGPTGCSSGLLPPDAQYATGSASGSIVTTKATTQYTYEWTSRKFGGVHSAQLNSECRSEYFESYFAAEGKSYKEGLDLRKRKFSRLIGNKTIVGNILLSDKSQPKKESGQFECIFGCKKRSGTKDLDASTTFTWNETGIDVRIDVQDDSVRFGNKVKNDHIEWWVSTAGVMDFEQKATPENTMQVMLYCEENDKISAVYGYPEKNNRRPEISGTCKVQQGGYSFHFTLPATQLSRRRMLGDSKSTTVLEEGDVFLLTFLVSDGDTSEKQESIIATSPLKWGMPGTFGRVILVDGGKAPLVSQNLMLE
jgi:Carbohydrate family 9 binding domain-like